MTAVGGAVLVPHSDEGTPGSLINRRVGLGC